MQPKLTCPECGNDDGSKIVGHEVRGVYDGVLYWVCLACDWAWSRDWTGYRKRKELAELMVRRHNTARALRREREMRG